MVNTTEHKTRVELSFDERFPIVRASQLSLKDSFLRYRTKTTRQKKLRDSIVAGIKEGLNDFRCPAMDPSFDRDGNLVYKEGEKPAIGKSAEFWYKEFKQFMPEKNSRMGTLKERNAFLGLLIKYLVEEQGYEISEAWRAVCDDSKDLGHYRNSKNAKHDFETTGSRKIWLFYDLANTRKIIADNNLAFVFWIGGGSFACDSNLYPIRFVYPIECPSDSINNSVAWLVLDV